MANTPVSIGTKTLDGGAGAATQTLVTTATVASGDAILVCFNFYGNGQTFASVTDSTGNTYAAVVTGFTGNTFYVGIAYCLSSAGLASGGNININLSGAPPSGYITASAFKLVGGLVALDVSATATQTTATALSVGPTAATAQTIELVLAAFGYYQGGASIPSFTAGGSYTALTAATVAGGADNNGCYPQYVVTAATGAQTATGTLGAAPTSSGSVVIAFTYPTSGAAAMTVPAPTLTATGREQAGSAAMTLPAPLLAATGREQAGSASLTLPAPILTASGDALLKASASLTLPAPVLASSGSQTQGSAALVLPPPVLAASGAQTRGSATLTIPAPLMAASAFANLITGATAGTPTAGSAYGASTPTAGSAYGAGTPTAAAAYGAGTPTAVAA